MGKIRDIVKKGGGRAILKYDANRDTLAFYELSGKMILLANVYAKWDRNNEHEYAVEGKNIRHTVNDAESATSGKSTISADT